MPWQSRLRQLAPPLLSNLSSGLLSYQCHRSLAKLPGRGRALGVPRDVRPPGRRRVYVRVAARPAGLASGLALAVRPAGVAEAPALKGGSRRSFLRSGQKGSSGALDAGGAAPDNARRPGISL